MKPTLCAFISLFLTLTPRVFAIDRYVQGEYSTIQAAIDDCNDGDTVVVAAGTYYENIRMKDGVTVKGAGANVTTIDGGANGHVVVFNLASGTISGFTITNSGNDPGYSAGIFTSQCTVVVKDNIIVNNHYGITISSSSNATVIGNEIVNNSGLAAIKVSDSDAGIANNVIAYNSGRGIYCSDSSPSIISNTITHNSSFGILCNPESTQVIANNIITHNEYGIFALGGSESPLPLLEIFHNDVWNNSMANYWYEWGTVCIPEDPHCVPDGESEPFEPQPGTGEISQDPLFVTGPLGDYYLSQIAAGQAVDSPCVDAGSDTAANLGMDVFTTRTDSILDSGCVDMGYHYQVPPPSPEDCDIDVDFFVDLFDFAILASQWLQSPGEPSADIFPVNGDEIVDINDLAGLTVHWLNCLVGKAENPNPGNNTEHIDPNGVFNWSTGNGAVSHDVYLGDNYNDVNNATLISDEYQDNVDSNTWDPCGLDANTAYFWRIDEIGPACTQKGDVWGFTTWIEFDPNLDLVSWWQFEEGGGTEANDSAGTNDGTLYGDPCWVAGYVGDWALDFNGVSDYVEVADDDSLDITGSEITLSAWIKPDSLANANIVRKRQSDDGYYLIIYGGKIRLAINDVGWNYGGYAPPSTGQWYHVVGVYDGSSRKVYVDSILRDTQSQSGNIVSNDVPLRIGTKNGSFESFGGTIDDVRIYDRALTEPEVLHLYQTGQN